MQKQTVVILLSVAFMTGFLFGQYSMMVFSGNRLDEMETRIEERWESILGEMIGETE